MTKWKVESSSKTQEFWMPERTYTLKSYAKEVAKAIKKGGRRARILKL